MAGKIDKAKGQAKEKLGRATGNRSMQTEGKIDRAAGTVKEKASSATNAVRQGVGRMKEKTTTRSR